MATGFTAGDACMVLIGEECKRGRFVAEVDEGYEVELRAPNGKRYLSPQVFVRDAVTRAGRAPAGSSPRSSAAKPKHDRSAKFDHRVLVTLKKASIGKTNAGLGIEFARGEGLSLADADESLREARINCRLSVEPGQEEMFDGSIPELTAVADVGRLSVGGSSITATLSFRREDVDIDAMADFAQKNATLDFSRVGDRQGSGTTEGEGE